MLIWFRHGGVAMYPLLLCSVLVLAIVLERLIVMRRSRANIAAFTEELRALVGSGDWEKARALCHKTPGPLGAIATAGLSRAGRSPEEVEDALANASALAIQRLESNLSVLGTIGGVAPFIGLFGTVLGIMRTFHDIQTHGQAGTAVVAGGISEALVATAAGLVVAVVSVVAYNTFLNIINRLETRLEAAQSDLYYVFTEDRPCVHHESAATPAGIG